MLDVQANGKQPSELIASFENTKNDGLFLLLT